MEFTKMQGAGNDFIIINNLAENISVDKLPELVKRLCTRRLSIGADGVMVIVPPEKGGDFAMLFYNADGSLGEMCGNGARCICRYGYEHGLAVVLDGADAVLGPAFLEIFSHVRVLLGKK